MLKGAQTIQALKQHYNINAPLRFAVEALHKPMRERHVIVVTNYTDPIAAGVALAEAWQKRENKTFIVYRLND